MTVLGVCRNITVLFIIYLRNCLSHDPQSSVFNYDLCPLMSILYIRPGFGTGF